MRRADRLLQIVQVLRRRKLPTTARLLAEELEVTKRTIYRDIATLQAARVPIEGEAGVGYILRAGYDLPPLMLTADEIEAVVLGMTMVSARGDAALARSAMNVLAKVTAVIPDAVADQIWKAGLLVPHPLDDAVDRGMHLETVRLAIRQTNKLLITYAAQDSAVTTRTIWPLGLYLFSHVTLVCAWCELRKDFRAFRADRMVQCSILDDRFNARSGSLMTAFLVAFTENLTKAPTTGLA